MKAFRERFREESWFPKPQNRTWTNIEKALERFISSELKKSGGKISKSTLKRDFDRFRTSYQSLFFQQVNDFLKRDVGVKNGLFAAMGAGAATLAEGHVYWMKDVTGDDDSLQADFDALNEREQRCAVHLQKLMRDLMLYHIELVVSNGFRTKLVNLKRQKEEANAVVQWKDAIDLLRSQLKNEDTRFLAESIFTVRRDEQSALIEWILFFMSVMTYCVTASIRLPNKLYYTMFIGQVSANEIKHVNFAYPKTEAECESFSFASYRATVKALPQDKFPVFHQKHVRAFTATMLITQDTVRASADDGNPKDGNTDKYCRTCKCKHAKGKHTKEGEKRYAAKQADRKTAKVNEKGKADEVLRAEKGGNATKSDQKDKGDQMPRRTPGRCFNCGKGITHFARGGQVIVGVAHVTYARRSISRFASVRKQRTDQWTLYLTKRA